MAACRLFAAYARLNRQKHTIRCCGSKVEHFTRNEGVVSSILTSSSMKKAVGDYSPAAFSFFPGKSFAGVSGTTKSSNLSKVCVAFSSAEAMTWA